MLLYSHNRIEDIVDRLMREDDHQEHMKHISEFRAISIFSTYVNNNVIYEERGVGVLKFLTKKRGREQARCERNGNVAGWQHTAGNVYSCSQTAVLTKL